MMRLCVALLLLASIHGLVSLGVLRGPPVDSHVENIHHGSLLMGGEVRNTREIIRRHRDSFGVEWNSRENEALDPIPGGLPALERQLSQRALSSANEEALPQDLQEQTAVDVSAELVAEPVADSLDNPAMGSLYDAFDWRHADSWRPNAMSPGRFNLPLPTLGGRQFWSDCRFFRGWRIQQHFYSEHFRLLDPSNTRRAWGTLEECQQALEEEKRTRKLEPMSGTAVIALHGILRSSQVWCDMEQAMKPDGVTFVRIDYPSTQKPIDEFAVQLQSVIHSLEGIDEIHIVAHSLGGLVVRKWCQDYSDPRVKRLVMIGTPNCGAELADMLQKNWIFRGVFGPSGQQLVSNPEGFISQLARPTMEFAVIAGAQGTPDGYNPLIPGDDDGIVTLKSALLPGAVDSITVRGLHSFQPWNPEVIAATRRYLKTGALRESGVREPIPVEENLAVDKR